MKSFLKYLLAAFIGTFIALLAIFFVVTKTVQSSLRALEGEEVKVKNKSVLVIDMADPVNDRPDSGPQFTIGGDFTSAAGLPDILDAIHEAKTDKRIKGIMIKLSLTAPSLATLTELRTAIHDFKSSGKFVVAFGDFCSQKSYYLASLADSIYLSPVGIFELRGFTAHVAFYKRALEKIGVEVQVYYAGQYKSATEPFRLEKMSPENREQLHQYLGSVYQTLIATIAADREMSYAYVDSIARNLVIRNPYQAKEYGFVDDVVYYDELLDILRERVGMDDSAKTVPLISVSNYVERVHKEKGKNDKVIAVVYAEGTIRDGSGLDGVIGGDTYAKEIRKLRLDKKVKAIVLRINSPGGSAPASDVIWREVALAAEAKPVIVSMGGLAASGGYFIAAPAHTIVAQPTTLTGSIGVFLIWPNMQGLYEDKLGITQDTVSIGRFSDLGNPLRPVNDDEALIFQAEVDRTYRDFVHKVAAGRHMTDSAIGEIAQGHIWSGEQAIRNGLVDTLGGLEDAIAIAADKAGIENYSVRAFPKPDSPFEKLRQFFGAQGLAPEWMNSEWLTVIDELNVLATERGMMARMMWDVDVR